MGVGAGVVLHGRGRTAVRVTLSQHGVHSAAFHLVVFSVDGFLFGRLVLGRKIGNGITPALKFRNSSLDKEHRFKKILKHALVKTFFQYLELRNRRTDIRELDNICFRGHRNLTEFA